MVLQVADLPLSCWLGTGTCLWGVLCSPLAGGGEACAPSRHRGDFNDKGQNRGRLLCLCRRLLPVGVQAITYCSKAITMVPQYSSGLPACSAGCAWHCHAMLVVAAQPAVLDVVGIPVLYVFNVSATAEGVTYELLPIPPLPLACCGVEVLLHIQPT